MENEVGEELTSQLGQAVMGEWLTGPDGQYPADKVGCEGGGQAGCERR